MHLLVISHNEQILFSPQKFALCWQDSNFQLVAEVVTRRSEEKIMYSWHVIHCHYHI